MKKVVYRKKRKIKNQETFLLGVLNTMLNLENNVVKMYASKKGFLTQISK